MIIYEKEFKSKKSFLNQLTTLYGISNLRASTIHTLLGLKKHDKIDNFFLAAREDLIRNIKDIVERDKKYIIENNLKYQKVLKRKELKLVGNYRNLRFSQHLPVHGQRTHTNAKTQKKRRK